MIPLSFFCGKVVVVVGGSGGGEKRGKGITYPFSQMELS